MQFSVRAFVKIFDQLYSQNIPLRPSHSLFRFKSFSRLCRHVQWLDNGSSLAIQFAPQLEHFMRFCRGLAQRQIVDHLMRFRFPNHPLLHRCMTSVHNSHLPWIGGPLAELLIPPVKSTKAIGY